MPETSYTPNPASGTTQQSRRYDCDCPASSGSGAVGANTVLTVNATGSVYTLTNALALVDFGTIDPTLVITSPGTWRISGRIRVDMQGATFAAAQFATVALRRTNNTAATLPVGGFGLCVFPIATTESSSHWIPVDILYTTLNSDDSISWFASMSVLPSAGSVTIEEAGITAQKIS